MTHVIKAFISFQHEKLTYDITEGLRLFPMECDSLLSALEPFRDNQAFRVRVYDLETPGGRLGGFLNGVSESPAVIVGRERHVGLVAASDALEQLLCDFRTRQRLV
jgi:hypothetical protein